MNCLSFSYAVVSKCNTKTKIPRSNHLNKQLVKCRAERAGEVGILNGMQDLGLVHVTAESVANSGVSKGA